MYVFAAKGATHGSCSLYAAYQPHCFFHLNSEMYQRLVLINNKVIYTMPVSNVHVKI